MSDSKIPPIDRILDLIQNEKKDLITLVYLSFGYSLLAVGTPIAIQVLVNNVSMGGVMQPLIITSIILFGLLIISGVIFALEAYVVELIERRLFVNTAMRVAKKTQGAQISIYDRHNPVELVNRFFDVTTVQKSTATMLTVGLMASLQIIIGSLVIVFYSLYFAIIIAALFLFFWFMLRVLGKNAEQTAIDESEAKYATASWLETIPGNFYLFKFYNGLELAETRTNALVCDYLNKRTKHFTHLFKQLFGAVIFYAFIATAMLLVGGMLVVNSQINLGQFVAAELIFFGILAAFIRITALLSDYYDILAAVHKIGVLDDLPQEEIKNNQTTLDALQTIAVEEISFPYNERITAVQNISFSLSKGNSLAIMGTSGKGKSTIVDLITGLRNPNQGQIEYNGIDLRQINLHTLRRVIGIAKEVEVFEGSIINNIRLENNNISMHEINDVLDNLGLADDFSKLERGLDTQLTGFGAPLSTTQLQRLMLARAIATKPELLIVDGLIDNLSQKQTKIVIDYLKIVKQNCMLILTTRSEYIAEQFDQQLMLTDSQRHNS